MMEEIKHYLFDDKISKEEAYALYKEKILKDDRFINAIDDDYLTIEEKYIAYYTFDACVNNHPYYFKNKMTNEAFDGHIDISHIQTDKGLILNELIKSDAKLIDEPSFVLYEAGGYQDAYKCFIATLKARALEMITKKHNIKPCRSYHIDIGLLEGFSDMKREIYYERIYIFRYKNEQRKKDFVSIFSCHKKDFYKLDFIYSVEYLEYLKGYKKPIEYIPDEFIDLYYIDSFNAYKSTKKKMEFEEPNVILKKIRENINYDSYSLHSDYLNSGVYFFKIKKYLKKLQVANSPIKKHIYMSYLTLRFQAESGLFLYDCATMGLLGKRGNGMKLKFLEFSFRLGNLRAKKILYEYYSMPINYNQAQIRKYS